MRRAHLRMLVLLAAVCLSPTPLIAQAGGWGGGLAVTAIDTFNRDRSVKNRWVVTGKVATLGGQPIQGAVVEVNPLYASGEFQSLVTDLQGNFLTDYWLNIAAANEFSAILTVTKKGFRTAHATIELTDPSQSQVLVIPVTLREPGEDPKLLPQADLILTARAEAEEARSFGRALGCGRKGLCARRGGVPRTGSVQTEP